MELQRLRRREAVAEQPVGGSMREGHQSQMQRRNLSPIAADRANDGDGAAISSCRVRQESRKEHSSTKKRTRRLGTTFLILKLMMVTMMAVLDRPWGFLAVLVAVNPVKGVATESPDDLVSTPGADGDQDTAAQTIRESSEGKGVNRNTTGERQEQVGDQNQQPLNPRKMPPALRFAGTGNIVQIVDTVKDSFLDPMASDPSCGGTSDGSNDDDCYAPPQSTIEVEERTVEVTTTKWDATCFKGGGDDIEMDEELTVDKAGPKSEPEEGGVCMGSTTTTEEVIQKVDKHWGHDPKILKMRDKLRAQSRQSLHDSRPPVFLLPGLASTRLVAWRFKRCLGALSSDIKVQDNVWLNINLVIRMGSVDVDCMKQCLELGLNQSDTNDWSVGCKLRPDEGLDAIASLAPGGIGADLLVGGTNTVYAWFIQWLADNLGYDVTNIVGLPYDWRLSPDKMEARDGFLSMMRRRIEAAVSSNRQPGIMVAHSMGNLVFRYFIEWLRVQMREEVFNEYIQRANRRAVTLKKQKEQQLALGISSQPPQQPQNSDESKSWTSSSTLSGWMSGIATEVDEWYDWFMAEGGSRHYKEDSSSENKEQEPLKSDGNDGNGNNGNDPRTAANNGGNTMRRNQLWELAKHEGDEKWLQWLETHIWTYVGLSAPMLGAVNPLRAVISGENMGLPIQDNVAREMEITFGSTHTLNPISTRAGFCDEWEADEWDEAITKSGAMQSTLACLDDIMNDIEFSSIHGDPWKEFPALQAIMRDRIDWNSGKPMISIDIEHCKPQNSEKSNDINNNGPNKRGSSSKTKDKFTCEVSDRIEFGAHDVQDAGIFLQFARLWKEPMEPLIIKKEQLEQSFFNSNVNNVLNRTWDRPLIKHVIMAYGVDIPTEVGYIYTKRYNVETWENEDGENTRYVDRNETEIPNLKSVLWEGPGGILTGEQIEASRGSIADALIKKKPKREPVELNAKGARLSHSGDGSVPYLSLSWAHTWLLHAARAKRFSEEDAARLKSESKTPLDYIDISHRPCGAMSWVEGPPPPNEMGQGKEAPNQNSNDDVLADCPHGTRYKPAMHRYHNVGISRTTGIEYTTSVIEAIGVEHKETTRNYDILAAVFTDVLTYMHDDLGLV